MIRDRQRFPSTRFIGNRGGVPLHPRRGAAAVELAMTLPLLLAVALGTADFGRIFKIVVSVNNAAEVGAFRASQSAVAAVDQQGVVDAVSKELLASDGVDQKSIAVTRKLGVDSAGNAMVTVTVQVKFTTVCNFPTDQVMITQSCQMRIRPL